MAPFKKAAESLGLRTTGARPIGYNPVPEGTPRRGSQWKKAVAQYYNRAVPVNTYGGVLPYRGNYMDLDPTYRNAYGQPLLRLTFDWRDNALKMSRFVTDRAEKILKAMGPSTYTVNRRTGQYNIVPYQTTHNTGGAIMGDSPGNSVVNKYLQSWDVPNLFVVGASAFPENAANSPTDTVGALAYHAADAIKNRYLKQPGPLA